MKILSKTKGAAQEYGRWSVNSYLGCPHGCTYCYLQQPIWREKLGEHTVRLKDGIVNEEHAFHLAMAEIIENREQIIKDGGLFMSFVTDPLCKETMELFLKIAIVCARQSIPVTMLTKVGDEATASTRNLTTSGYLAMNFSELERTYIAIGHTLTGHDELEQNASTHAFRLRMMRYLGMTRFKTWASIEPVIDFPSSLSMVEQAIDAGCSHFKIGLQTYGNRVIRRMYDHDACIQFIHDVMNRTRNRATVYWKQSARDFLGEEDYARATVGNPGIVDRDWSMFDPTA